MKQDDKTKIRALMELVAGLERENAIQNELIKTQNEKIAALEDYIQKMETLINEALND